MVKMLKLTVRRQSPRTTGYAGWRINDLEETWNTAETAMILVDVWDKHWSWGAEERAGVLAARIDTVVKAARHLGIFIVHAPSEVMAFYADHPARRWVASLSRVAPPQPLPHSDPPVPVYALDVPTDTLETAKYRAWSRQHEAIEILPTDAISDDGDEICGILQARGIRNIIFAGVHTNKCMLERSFAIKRMVGWGFSVVLARDLTDAMYNPMRPPYVSQAAGTRLVIEYIEKFWCPTITSDDLTFVRA
jgi:nicotinamidase-related amidase